MLIRLGHQRNRAPWTAQFERPAEQVLRDVTSGYVLVEAARRDYGVVINALGRHFTLDVEAAEALRRERLRMA